MKYIAHFWKDIANNNHVWVKLGHVIFFLPSTILNLHQSNIVLQIKNYLSRKLHVFKSENCVKKDIAWQARWRCFRAIVILVSKTTKKSYKLLSFVKFRIGLDIVQIIDYFLRGYHNYFEFEYGKFQDNNWCGPEYL